MTEQAVRCPACDHRFIPARAVEPESVAEEERLHVPPGLRVTREGGGLAIQRRWFAPQFLGMLFFAIAWDSFLVFWYAIAFSGEAGDGSWIMILFPVAHVAVGVSLTYSVLAGLLNTTRITVRSGRIQVRHGPVPWRGNLERYTSELEQLYVVRRHTRTKKPHGMSGMFDVMALGSDQTAFHLVRGLPNLQMARYIEKAIEQRLGIEDRPVSDEAPA